MPKAIPNFQSEFLREPNLLVPGKKPVGPVKIDYLNSLTRDLALVGYADTIDNSLRTANIITTGAPATLVTNSGQGRVVNGTNYWGQVRSFPPAGWTLFFFGRPDGVPTNSKQVIGFVESPGSGTNDRSIRMNSAGHWTAYVYSGTGVFATTGIAPSLTTPEAIVATCDGSTLKIISKETIAGNSTIIDYGYTGYATPEFNCGYAGEIGATDDFVYLISGLLHRVWTEDEATSWINDPYQFLIPA